VLRAAVALLLALAAAAEARSLAIARFDVELVVASDGSLHVSETLQVRFTGAWNGLYRTIPVDYRTPQGWDYHLILDQIEATDGRGRPYRLESSRDRHYRKLKIWIPGAADATRTVVLHYRVPNALRFFEGHDELYWNVTGDEWEVPIGNASARVELPPTVTGLRAVAFTGGHGSRAQDADVEIGHHEVRVLMRRPLAFREGLTAVVGWNKGAVREPTIADRTAWFLRGNWPLLAPVLAFGFMYGIWRRHGRDPRRGAIVARYEPPAGLTPAEVGTLADNSPDVRDVTATLVDLAVRGFVRIEERTESGFLGFARAAYTFHLRRPPDAWTALQPFERTLLAGMFGNGALGPADKVDLATLENSFYRQLPPICDGIFARLLARGYYRRRPDRVRKAWVGIAIGLTLGLVSAAVWMSQQYGVAPLPAVLGAALSGFVVIGFGHLMPARTRAGSLALEEVLGFEEFLARVEGDRLARLAETPELFEKYLPYALALGVEERWARAFADVGRPPPDWYAGTNGQPFAPRSLSQSLHQLSQATSSAFASAPRSAGGSGFGGGGSSGGGSGGGGGGGF
jgi:uncharacterized membrane protein YgcG